MGPLRVQHTSVETTHGTASLAYAGTIAICLMMDAGQTFKYHVLNAIYNPNSPFNILGIPFLRDYFGAKNTIPNRDDDGTYVRSSASKTTFVWDHGQHSQDFTHDARLLPVLTLNTGVGYFQARIPYILPYPPPIRLSLTSLRLLFVLERKLPLSCLTQILVLVKTSCTQMVPVRSQGWFIREPCLMVCGIPFEGTMD